jgi:hypothetical protein
MESLGSFGIVNETGVAELEVKKCPELLHLTVTRKFIIFINILYRKMGCFGTKILAN